MFIVNFDIYETDTKERKSVVFEYEMDADEFLTYMKNHNNADMVEQKKVSNPQHPVSAIILEGMRDAKRNQTFDSDILHGYQWPEYCEGVSFYRKINRIPKGEN